jgi:competence ComEA-like helix-hairpin-helix protein
VRQSGDMPLPSTLRLRVAKLIIIFVALLSMNCAGERNNTRQLSQLPVISENSIDINSASIDELEKLPAIGKSLAVRIVDFRTKHGRFRRPEHLMLVQGISERRFRQISALVRAE